eukprot:TRINITY_DN74941_c0_g1_i1.p1 TRINITY_DN74941_c0_g1~~TRINITY_DN74941_c0_g1_i1.p1  ORF type:complete len:121 (-),score=22.33 TRINITY_DN74941_c0_g1_i1:114-476(-)
MLGPSCVFIVALLAGSSSAGLFKNIGQALECPQNFLVKDKINDKQFMSKQIRCFLEDVGCDEFGKKAMDVGPLILAGHCPQPMCNACTKRAVHLVVAKMQNDYPRKWFQIQKRMQEQQRG